ncbi:MAG: hypothetical protein GF383_09560 [Candidatus Lokiarchaeota archaeon]|nr:hypothetical protein [Candidatus Lokiarchaeota archaeon]
MCLKNRPIPPNLFVYPYAHELNLEWLKNPIYTSLLLKFFYMIKEVLADKLLSHGIFSSVAKIGNKRHRYLLFYYRKNVRDVFN